MKESFWEIIYGIRQELKKIETKDENSFIILNTHIPELIKEVLLGNKNNVSHVIDTIRNLNQEEE